MLAVPPPTVLHPAGTVVLAADHVGRRLVTYLVVALVIGTVLLVGGIIGLIKTRHHRRGRHR